MSMRLPVYQPFIGEKEKEYVNECLSSGWISSKGSFVERFECEFASFLGVKHAISVCNGTVALHLALKSVGIGEGDEVIVPSFTYIASVNAISYCGAVPIFCDSELDYWQINPSKIEELITKKTKAILLVHLYGHPCDVEPIRVIAKKHGLVIVEDCAESTGSKYNGEMTGVLGEVSTFSFFGNKTITTGEGGMVATNHDDLAWLARKLKGQGLHENREYWHDVIGYNYRMTNICAALGCAQLESIDEKISRKREIAALYKAELSDLPLGTHKESKLAYHTYWMNSVLLEDWSVRDDLRKHLAMNGIETRPFFWGAHTMPMYSRLGAELPITEVLSKSGINLPSYPQLSDEDIVYIAQSIRSFF
jgi:perosamine synthetase